MLNVKRGTKFVAERFVADGMAGYYVLFAYHLGSDIYHICFIDGQDVYSHGFYHEKTEGRFHLVAEPDIQTQQILVRPTGPLV